MEGAAQIYYDTKVCISEVNRDIESSFVWISERCVLSLVPHKISGFKIVVCIIT
jgi:hypothetical protein